MKLLREEDLCTDDNVVLPHLTLGVDGLPSLKLVRTQRGLHFALTSGEVTEYKDYRSALNYLGVCTFQVKGFGCTTTRKILSGSSMASG